MKCAKRGESGPVVNCAWVQGFVDDIFHELGQPLTALHCSLELALRRKSTPEQLQDALKQAVVLSERLLKIASSERQMLDAGKAGNVVEMDLAAAVRELAEDMTPVAESCGKRICIVANEPAKILADPVRISRALFAAVDLALYRLRTGKRLLLATYRDKGKVNCYIGEDRAPLRGLVSSMDLRAFGPGAASRIVGRMVGAAGGSAWELFLHNYAAFVLSFPVERG